MTIRSMFPEIPRGLFAIRSCSPLPPDLDGEVGFVAQVCVVRDKHGKLNCVSNVSSNATPQELNEAIGEMIRATRFLIDTADAGGSALEEKTHRPQSSN